MEQRPIADIISIAKISTYLCLRDTMNQQLLRQKTQNANQWQQIAISVYFLEQRYLLLLGSPEVRATATITIDSVPTDGYNIEALVNDPDNGSISLGSYTKGSGDTDTTILAASIVTELAMNAYSYSIASADNIITITARAGLGSSINGNNLSVTADVEPEHKAKAFFGFPTRVTTGTVYTTTVVDPDLGTITLAVYTQQAGDTTDEIFDTNFLASLNANIYNYTTTLYLTTGFYIVAPTGYGSSINGNNATIQHGASSELADFLGGVTEIGIIPNTLTQFTGGVTAVPESTSSLRQAANYVYYICGKYAGIAAGLIGQGGTVVQFVNQNPIIITWIKFNVVVGHPELAVGDYAVTPADGDTVIVIQTAIQPKSEVIFYNGVDVKLYPNGDFNYIATYGLTTTTYRFSQPFSLGLGLDFQAVKRVVDTPSGARELLSVPITVSTSGSTITVPELGTFVSLTYKGGSYDYQVHQSGKDLDLHELGSDFMGEEMTVFYYE